MPNFQLLAAAADNVLHNVSTLSPASPMAEWIRFLFYFVTAVGVFILAIVWGVLFYSLVRFRRKRNIRSPGEEQPTSAATEPPQVYGSIPIEIAWTVAPGIIVLLLMLVIVRTAMEVRVRQPKDLAGTHAVTVSVVGHQWWWEYIIKSDGDRTVDVVTANEIHLPAGSDGDETKGEQATSRPVYLTLESADVCHSFWVPRLAGKTDLIPGRVNEMWFETTEPGLYVGQCAEYCGAQHANMLLRMYIDTPENFTAWLENEAKPAVNDAGQAEGQRAFMSQSCVNCHTIRGTPAHGKFGPDLTHLAARKTFAGGMIELNRDNLRKWIRDPQEIKVECLMPAFGLSDRNVNLITDYLMTLK
jgi:cytochrome c oxidase subunit 2